MNKNEAQHLADTINTWSFPYVVAYVSTLGGEERSSVMVTVALEPRSSWRNGIMENSRYAKLAFHSSKDRADGVSFEHFSGRGVAKIRAWKTKDKPALYKKLQLVERALRSQA